MGTDFTPVAVTAPIVTAGQNCWQIRNFYVTAQPTEAGLTTASKLGIKSVICLRDATEVAKPPYPAFDPEEDARNIVKHGISLALDCLTFTFRGRGVRAISLRKANKKESSHYGRQTKI